MQGNSCTCIICHHDCISKRNIICFQKAIGIGRDIFSRWINIFYASKISMQALNTEIQPWNSKKKREGKLGGDVECQLKYGQIYTSVTIYSLKSKQKHTN